MGVYKKFLNNCMWYLSILCICIVFLLLFSISTSPLTSNTFGSDSAFFQVVGQSMTKGQIMYHDIFDNKGPYLYLIQYCGQMLSYGRGGIFVIQLVNLFVTLYFVDRTCQIVCGQKMFRFRFLSIIIFFILLELTLDCGNLSEEFSLPFLFICLFIFFRILSDEGTSLLVSSVIIGISFGVLAFIRITNAEFVCVIVVALFFYFILERKFRLRSCLLFIVGFLAGILTACIPACIYCIYNNIFPEMLYATFTFNYFYGTFHAGTIRYDIISVLFVMTFLAVWINRHERGYAFFSLVSLISTVSTLLLGHAYLHYYQLIIPPVLANIWLVMRGYDKIRISHKKIYLGLVLSIMVILNIRTFVYQGLRTIFALGSNTPGTERTVFGYLAYVIEKEYAPDWSESYGYRAAELVYDILERIPDDAYEEVYNYNTKPYWLRVSGLLPYHKYCQTQESFISVSPQIKEEIDAMFEQNPPQYVVVENYDDIHNNKILERLEEEYCVEYQNKVYVLFKRQISGS